MAADRQARRLLSALAGMVATELLELDDVVERETLHQHFEQALAERLSGFDAERRVMADALVAGMVGLRLDRVHASREDALEQRGLDS